MPDDQNPDDLPLDEELPEGETAPETEQAEPEAELVISLGEDDAPDDDGIGEEIDTSEMGEVEARTVARLRDALKAKAKAAKEAERKAAAAEAALAARDAAARPKIEEKPYPKPIDYGYDDDLHEAAVREWTDNQLAVKAEKGRAASVAKARQDKLTERFDAYTVGKKTLRVPGFDAAEATVMADLSNEQQQAILECAADPAKLVYALGNSPKARKELAALDDPRLFAYRLAKIEGEIKVTQKTPPPVETRLSGGSGAGASIASAGSIDKLRKAAEQSGDYTAYFKAKAALKSSGKAR